MLELKLPLCFFVTSGGALHSQDGETVFNTCCDLRKACRDVACATAVFTWLTASPKTQTFECIAPYYPSERVPREDVVVRRRRRGARSCSLLRLQG